MAKKGWKVFLQDDNGTLLSTVMPDADDINNIPKDNEWVEYKDIDELYKRGFSLFGIDKNETHRPYYFFSDHVAENNYERYMQLLKYLQHYGANDSGKNKVVYEVEVDDILSNNEEELPEGYDFLRDFPEEYQARKIKPVKNLNPSEEDIDNLIKGEGSALAKWKAKEVLKEFDFLDIHKKLKNDTIRYYIKNILLEDNIRHSIDRMFPQPTTISDHILKAVKRRF